MYICDFDRILKTECNLQHFIRNCRIKNFDDFEKDEAEVLFVGSRTSKCEGEKDDQMLHYKQEEKRKRRKSKCCGVLIKHCRKVKGEQAITLLAQQLKTKNINVVLGQLFCRQCKTKFLLETDPLY